VELFELTRATETYCALYQKKCAAGEVVEFGLWAVPIMLEEARTTAQKWCHLAFPRLWSFSGHSITEQDEASSPDGRGAFLPEMVP
jgi:hypothetical protein